MRLHRVIAHLKMQNWTAVALDVVITVVGVFIGIQVSNWNGARQDRQRAHEVLVDLRLEFAEFDEAAKGLANFYAQSLRNEIVLLASLRAGRVRPEDQIKIKDALALGLIYGDPPPQSGTYRDLLSSGKLGLVHDKELRVKLIEYDQSIDIVARSDTNIQLGLTGFYPAFARHMVADASYRLPTFASGGQFVDAKTDFTNVRVDYDALVADPAFRTAAEQVFMAQQYRLINIRLSQAKIAKIRERIDAALAEER